MDDHLDALRREVLGVAAVGKLFELPSSGPPSRDTLLKLVTHVAAFDSAIPVLARHLAEAEIDRMSNFLKDLGRGRRVIYDGDDWYWCLSLTTLARTSIDATTYFYSRDGAGVVDDDLWLSKLGQNYLQLQAEAARRGVAVRRIFIVERTELASHSQIRQLVTQHQRLGIQVRLLDASDLPSAAGSFIPVVIFDSSVLYEQTPTRFPASPGYAKTTLVLQLPQVQAMSERFQQLWSIGRLENHKM
jgi:hypothetical protein